MIKPIHKFLYCLWSITLYLADIIFAVLIGVIIYWGIVQVTEKEIGHITGLVGLILSLITLYLTIVRKLFQKAMLSYEINIQESKSSKGDSTSSIFYRLRIENYGLTKATNCVGRLIGVWSGNGEQLTKFDALSLYWSRQSIVNIDGKDITTFKPIDIQGYGDFDFLDIATSK